MEAVVPIQGISIRFPTRGMAGHLLNGRTSVRVGEGGSEVPQRVDYYGSPLPLDFWHLESSSHAAESTEGGDTMRKAIKEMHIRKSHNGKHIVVHKYERSLQSKEFLANEEMRLWNDFARRDRAQREERQ